MRKNRAISKANKLSPSRQRVLAFERLGTRALLSATPIQPMLDDSAVSSIAISASFMGHTSTTAPDPLPVWTKPILTLNAAGNIEVLADQGVIFSVEYTNLDQYGHSVSKVLQGTGTPQEVVLSTADLVSLAYSPAQGGRIYVSVASNYPVPAGFRMPHYTVTLGSPLQTGQPPSPGQPTPTPPPGFPSPSPVTTPTSGTPILTTPAPQLTVRNVVRELRPKIVSRDRENGLTETEDMSVPPYFVTTDGIVDVASLLEGAAWQYSVDNGGWIDGNGTSLTLPVAGPQRLAVKQVVPGGGGGIPAMSTLGVVVDPDWDKPVLPWSGTVPNHYHAWFGSRVTLSEQQGGDYAGTIMITGFSREHGTARDITGVAANGQGFSSGLLIDSATYRRFIAFLPKTQRDRLVPTGQLNELGKPQMALIPKGTPLLLNGSSFDAGTATLPGIIASLEVFLQSDINGDGSVAERPASAGGVRVEDRLAEMSAELAGDAPLGVFSARGVPGVTGGVYIVGDPGLTADNTYEAADLEDYKVLRLSNGKPIAAPSVPVALRPNASGVEVLFSLGTASPTYQSRVFSLQSGRAIGKPSAVFRDIGVLEAEYATDLNGDQVIGNAITIAQVLDPSNLEPEADDEASIGVYRVSGVPGVTGSVVAVGDANLQSGETYVDADLARMTVLRGTNGKPLGTGFTPVAVRDDGAQVEVLFKPSPSSSVHQTQRFNATSGRAIGRPSKPVQNLASIEGVFAQDLNVDGVIGAAFTVTSVVDGSGAMAGGGPGNYGLYWVAGLRQGPSLVVSDRGLVAGGVYQEGDVGTTIELVSRKGAPLASGFPAVAISESGDTVDVLYRAGAAYQTQRFNIASGRAVGVAGPVRSDVASLEDEFDQDLNDDGTVGASAT